MQTASTAFGSLVTVRAFITYHDFMHGAIARGSRLASKTVPMNQLLKRLVRGGAAVCYRLPPIN
jgi:hypothetical protein